LVPSYSRVSLMFTTDWFQVSGFHAEGAEFTETLMVCTKSHHEVIHDARWSSYYT